MQIDIISALPEIFEGPLNNSIIKRAREKNIIEINIHNLRDYSTSKHKRVDDYAFGGGAGMVMTIEPIYRAINYLSKKREYDEIIYTSPDGEKFDQQKANNFSTLKNMIILCGHYKGVDQRVRDYLITREVSIGDYVLTGGELAAAVMIDSITRLLPGAISDETSALTDSFQDNLLAPPVYTRPSVFNGWEVPGVLLSGHSANIENWRMEKSIERTKKVRPDLLKTNDPGE